MRLRQRPAFRRLFAAQTISRWGDTFNTVALVIVVFQLTGSGLKVAGTVGFEIAPVLLLGPIAGAVVDQRSRIAVMVTADVFRAALMVALVVAPHELWVIYAVAFGLSAGSVFFNPASGAVLPSIVDEEQLVGANSALWSAAVTSQIALAPLAGLLVATLGARPAFAINAASFIVSAALLRGLPDAAVEAAPGRWRTLVIAGLGLARTEPLVRLLVQTQALAALSAGATSGLLVVLARDRFEVGPAGFGMLLSAIGVGAALGPLLLRRFVREPMRARFLFGPYVLRAGVDGVLATTTSAPLAGAALTAYGAGTSTGMVVYSSLVQSRIAAEIRGRAFTLFDVTWQSARLISLGVGGVLADRFGVRFVYAMGGLLLLLAGVRGFAGKRAAGLT